MPITYAYLVGVIGLGIVFSLLCLVRKDLRRAMLYSGLFYLLFMSAVFVLLKMLSSDPGKAITPGYWSPPSILDLNRKTGGLGIEDAMYMFFVGAIAAGLYEIIFNFKIAKTSQAKLKKGHAIFVSLLISVVLFVFTPMNTVDFFIIFQLLGAIIIIWQRRDLLPNSLLGGAFFMFLYGLLFVIFKLLFPSFLSSFYNLERTSHVWFLGIPLEEFLYAFSLGMMWAPIYEYEHQVKDRRRRWSGLRRVSLAAGGAKR